MTSFTSSFRSVVFGRETRRRYAIVSGTLMIVVLATSLGCQFWINQKTVSSARASRELGPSTDLIVAGSSHLLAQNSTTIREQVVNVSHAANSLRMMFLTLRSAIRRAPNVRHVVVELGHVVLTSDPTRLRGHSFVELGVAPWEIPGTIPERIGRCAEYFPPMRVPRLTPQNVLVALRPELNAEAQGFAVQKVGDYVENSGFRAAGIHLAMSTEASTIQDNLVALEDLLDLLKRQEIHVVIVLTPHMSEFRQSMNDQERALLDTARGICAGYANVSVLDLYDAESNGFERDNFVDCDHLNMLGHQKLGALLSAAVSNEKISSLNESPSR